MYIPEVYCQASRIQTHFAYDVIIQSKARSPHAGARPMTCEWNSHIKQLASVALPFGTQSQVSEVSLYSTV